MRYTWRLISEAFLLGVVGALSAQLFRFMLQVSQSFFLGWLAGYQPPRLPEASGELMQQVIGVHGLWLIPLATTLGGLISGIIVYSLAPETEGHGTDAVVKAFHRTGGFIRARVAPVKVIASAITIGSGGAAGREGPTALISAGLASIYATFTHRSDEERRLLVLIGMAAGLSAIFRSPIGTAIFAIEVLYRDIEFEAGALLYTMLGSVVAYAIGGLFVGWQPLFYIPGLSVPEFIDYLWYIVLGVLGGLVATILPVVFYGMRDVFNKLSLPPHIKPAIGGLGVGLIAIVLPQVLGGGYGWILEVINGDLTLKLMLILLFAKILAFALTISSGGSGGVFAPSLYVGAMLGGSIGQLFHRPLAAFVIVGMATVFAGAARVPIATLLMVVEMTGGYQLLVPAALAVMISYLVQGTLSSRLKYRSLYEAQVPSRADSPAHHLEHVQTALRLLGEYQISFPSTISHLDLYSLLASGIPVDLPDSKQLHVGVLKSESPWVDKTIESGYWEQVNGGMKDEIEIIAIVRKGNVLFPHSDTVLQGGDRLLLITSPNGWEWMGQHLGPLSSE